MQLYAQGVNHVATICRLRFKRYLLQAGTSEQTQTFSEEGVLHFFLVKVFAKIGGQVESGGFPRSCRKMFKKKTTYLIHSKSPSMYGTCLITS